jgi:hypothetical protein
MGVLILINIFFECQLFFYRIFLEVEILGQMVFFKTFLDDQAYYPQKDFLSFYYSTKNVWEVFLNLVNTESEKQHISIW